MRLVRITAVDLNVFDFDYDLTWMAFFINAEEQVYGRYGGRDAEGPDTRNSLPGLKYAMRAALDAHRRQDKSAPKKEIKKEPLYAESMPSARTFRSCIHCHQVKENQRDDLINAGKWDRASIWAYPLPENVGISLEVDRGNVVRSVASASPASQTGIRSGDVLQRLNGFAINSFADAQYALHRAPAMGQIPIEWLRAGKVMTGTLRLFEGWRKTNVAWRPSMLPLLPSLTINGPDLTPQEKKALGLTEKQLAFRQRTPIHSEARAMGVREGDVITGIDNQRLLMTAGDFHAHVRRNYLVGDRVILNIIRAGKCLELPVKLR